MRAILALLGVLAACSEREPAAVTRGGGRPRRVIEPPSRSVRALPPHAIRADGVGPYKLNAPVAEVLEQLPSGPRIRQFSIPGLVHRYMLRGEEDAILIGAEPQGRATFIAVIRGEIARTESGVQVGSTRDELVRALGAPLEARERARDPRIVTPTRLPSANVLFDVGQGVGPTPAERVAAIVLTPPAVERAGTDASDGGCPRPAGDRSRHLVGACLSAAGELVRTSADTLAVLSRDESKEIATARVPGLVFAAPLRQLPEGRDEVVAVVHTADEQARSWSLVVYRMLDGKLQRVVEPSLLYTLTAATARWIGADLREVDLFVELIARPEAIESSGLLVTRIGSTLRDVVVVSPTLVSRRRPRGVSAEPVDAASDAGVSDAARGPTLDAR